MKHLLLTALIILTTIPFVKGQSHHDTVSIIQHRYYFNGNPVKPRMMLSLMKDSPDAFNRMKRAMRNHTIANTLGITGGVMTGVTVVMLVAGNEPEMEILIAGACYILLSIPFYTLYNLNAITAVHLFNSDIRRQGSNAVQLNLGLTNHGIGLTCRF